MSNVGDGLIGKIDSLKLDDAVPIVPNVLKKPKKKPKPVLQKPPDRKPRKQLRPLYNYNRPTVKLNKELLLFNLKHAWKKQRQKRSSTLRYPSMKEYISEISWCAYLDDLFETFPSENVVFSWTNHTPDSKKEKDVSHEDLGGEVCYTATFDYQKEMNTRLSKSERKLQRSPFAKGQTFILNDGTRAFWCGYAESVDLVDFNGRTLGKNDDIEFEKIADIVVLIMIYPWEVKQLPKSLPMHTLNVLPCSATATRILRGLTKLSNKEFISMLLGQTPITQIAPNTANFVAQYTEKSPNPSQKIAIGSILANSITVLQGPPGTGKTATIVETILQLLAQPRKLNGPIVVVAHSNIAIDNIAEKLLEIGQLFEQFGHLKDTILRIVSAARVNDYSDEGENPHPLGKITLHHKVYEELSIALKAVERALRDQNPNGFDKRDFQELFAAKGSIIKRLMGEFKVVLTTTVGSGCCALQHPKEIPVVIMDEATQSSEPSTIIPLSLQSVEKFVLVGDHKQLNFYSDIEVLEYSLFERVIENGTYERAHMLDTQYRMHPYISAFPRDRFYNGLLQDGVTVGQRSIKGIDKPLLFWDTRGRSHESMFSMKSKKKNKNGDDGEDGDGGGGYDGNLGGKSRGKGKGKQKGKPENCSYRNFGEVDKVIKVLKTLISEKKIVGENIGVITPYRAQRDLLSETIQADKTLNPTGADIKEETDGEEGGNQRNNKNGKRNKKKKEVTVHIVSGIMIASIDAFQGREKDFIVFSCVRSNDHSKVGFVSDRRRMNVALTRAKYGLILVGDLWCLTAGSLDWRDYLSNLKEQKFVHEGKKFKY